LDFYYFGCADVWYIPTFQLEFEFSYQN